MERVTSKLSLKIIFQKGAFYGLPFFLMAGLLSSCAGSPVPTRKEKVIRKFVNQKIFYFPYDGVWRAAQLALKYPIAINNMDNGVLETDLIKADDGFLAPGEARTPSSGVRYKITLVLAKGKVDGRESVRVTVSKSIEKKRDFFSDPETLVSDGLEEMTIFYRIERELLIDEALKKAAKQANK